MKRLMLACALAASSSWLAAQTQMPTGEWPTYNGDYTGRRFSTLTKVNDKNVQHLSLAWSYRLSVPGAGPIKGTPLMVNGVIYLTAPDHVWAIDARTSREIWHWENKAVGGILIGNRGAGIKGDYLYVETRDCNLVSLTIKDGRERWRKNLCNLDQYYYASVAPIVIGGHVICGVSGDDLDVPGYLESHNAETGEREWRWYVVPQNADDPGIETWPNLDAAKHGGGMTWQPVTYDPDLRLLYVTTGNPQPVVAYANRPGDNPSPPASSRSIGRRKMKWYFQSSPHDTHDWDATQRPSSRRRVQRPAAEDARAASRNWQVLLLDRATGKALVSSDFVRDELVEGVQREGTADSNPRQESADRRRARDAESRRRRELAAAVVQSADRPVLRQRRAGLQRLVHLRSRRQSAGLGRHRSRRLVAIHGAGGRLQDGKGPLEPQVGRRRHVGPPQHGGQPALHRRRLER
jgi:alcohol dehydrogenase (cytochrome c)